MSYIERVLQPGEEIKYVSQLHWIVYLPGISLVTIGLIGFLFSLLSFPGESTLIAVVLTGTMCILGLASILQAWFKRWTTEIVVTNRRVIYKRGFIRRYTTEMNMDKVESVHVDQSFWGRILDYGTVIVRGTGTGIEPLHKIDSPLEFRNFVTAR